jgi:hypothetical protein
MSTEPQPGKRPLPERHFPIIFAPCEAMDPPALKWLLDHGANPNCRDHGLEVGSHRYPGTALDYLIGGYVRFVERLSVLRLHCIVFLEIHCP